MTISIGDIIVWIIVGGFAGSMAGAIVKGSKKGYGPWKNIAIGLAGAFIGGVIFKVFNIDLGLGDLGITFSDLISALLGSFLLMGGLWLYKKKKGGKTKAPE